MSSRFLPPLVIGPAALSALDLQLPHGAFPADGRGLFDMFQDQVRGMMRCVCRGCVFRDFGPFYIALDR